MKKKWLLTGLCMMLLTGCANTASLSTQLKVTGSNKEHFNSDTAQWQNLMSDVEEIENKYNDNSSANDIWVSNRIYDDENISTYTGEENSYIAIYDIDSYAGQEALHKIKTYIGDEIVTLVEEVRRMNTESGTQDEMRTYSSQMLTKIIGEYGVAASKAGDRIAIYITHESFVLTQKEDIEFIKPFKTGNFLMKSYSQGTEESVFEIATPSFKIRTYGSDLDNTTSFYQFFRNTSSKLGKVRMVINIFNDNPIDNAEFEPLEAAISVLGGTAELSNKIQMEVNQILEGSSEGRVIKEKNLKCTIKKYDTNVYYEKLIEIVLSK